MNLHFSKKKLLLLGFLFVVLLVIPLTIYLVQQQQETRSHAEASTTLSFNPPDATAQFGSKVSFDVMISPGTNRVSAVKLILKYDSTKLTASPSSFTLNPESGLHIQEGPIVDKDTLSVSLNIGTSTTAPIITDTKIGTVTFDVTGSSTLPTEVSFDSASQVSSLDGAAQGQSYENVLLPNSSPATITIQGGSSNTSTPTATLSPSPAGSSSGTQVQAQDGSSNNSSNNSDSSNEAPVCSSLGTDVSASGAAPYTVNFTASGTDTDGTIAKVSLNFGEGEVEDITSGGGIGSDSVSVVKSHTYETAGTFTATAVVTDNQGKASDSVNCSTTITVTDDGSSTSTDTNTTSTDDTNSASDSATISPSPLPPTGPSQTIMGVGALGGILFLIGALLFLAL